jgi:hypothetical protein
LLRILAACWGSSTHRPRPRSSAAKRKTKWRQEKSTPGDDETLLREAKHGLIPYKRTQQNNAKWISRDFNRFHGMYAANKRKYQYNIE